MRTPVLAQFGFILGVALRGVLYFLAAKDGPFAWLKRNEAARQILHFRRRLLAILYRLPSVVPWRLFLRKSLPSGPGS